MSHYERGVLSMANKGKNMNNSQWFVTFKNVNYLDGVHVVFGEMLQDAEGLRVLRAIEVGGSKSGRPTSKFVIEKCGILEKEAI